ncbi:phage tail tip fiber protein [Rhizobium sp. LEGMi198b]
MKLLILLLNVACFWLAADPAHAEPISTAIAAISSFIGSIGVIGKLVLTVAINVGMSLIEKATAKKSDTSTPTGVKLEITMGDDQPMSFVLGNYATAGRRKYVGTWGDDGKTPNAYLTDVIELGNLPSSGLNGMWADDRHCTILWGEPAADGRGYPVSEYRVNGKDYLWVKFVDGTQTVADAFLRTKFGSDADRPFKATMIGYGCPYVVVTARYNTTLFSGLPNWLFEVGSIKLYDLRKDSTNGGSGAHRWNNPSTWEPSLNPVVMVYNIVRGVYYGNEWVYGGQNLAAFCLAASSFIAGANACDITVSLSGGGTEPSSRAGIEVHCDQQPLDTVNELLKVCNGRMAEVGGIFKILIGVPGAAVYSFSDDDVVVTQEQDYQPFPSLGDTYNAIEATYPEPSEKWATKDAPGRYYPDLEAADGNRRLPVQIELPAAPYANQVQRVGQAMILDYRRFRTHQFYLAPDAYPLEPNDCVSYSSARNGYSNKKFLVVKVAPQRNFLVLVTIKEVDPSDYDWDPSQQLPTAVGWVGPITPPAQPMYGWQVEPATINDSAGVPWRPSIKISSAPDQDDVTKVWVQVRLAATGDIVFDSDSTRYGEPYSWVINANFKGSTDYEARGRYIPFSTRLTDWSDWLPVTTPNVVITDLIVDLQHVKNDILDRFKGLQQELLDVRPLVEQLMINTQLSDAVLDSAHRNLVASVGQSNATFSENIQVVADAANAAVSQVTTLTATVADNKAQVDVEVAAVTSVANAAAAQATSLSATVGDLSAQGLVKFSVAADQTGVNARFSIALRTSTANSYVESGMFLEIYTVGGVQKSRFSVMADQFSVLNPDSIGTSYLPLVFQSGVLKLQNVKVEWADIVNASIQWAQIQNVSITSAQIQDAAITNAKIGNAQITTSNLDFNQITDTTTQTRTGNGQPGGEIVLGAAWVINNPNPNPVLTSVNMQFTIQAGSGSSYVRLVNDSTGAELARLTINAPSSGSTTNSVAVMLIEPRPGAAGNYQYSFRAYSGVQIATCTVTQLWWKR